MESTTQFKTKRLPEAYDYLAPDGSEIRLLPEFSDEFSDGGLSHCTLPPGKVSMPCYHKTVQEIWYCLSGEGEVWRKAVAGGNGETVVFQPGVSLTIPVATAFQFRNTGRDPLCFVIVTIPHWPGPQEAIPTDGKWPASNE
jgi:mannose-6-phosphate isomerase-like protein (cupin superfamily)